MHLGSYNILLFSTVFHPKCVDEWLQKWQRVCPLCKSLISRRERRNELSPLLRNEGQGEEESRRGQYGSVGEDDDNPEVEVLPELQRENELST